MPPDNDKGTTAGDPAPPRVTPAVWRMDKEGTDPDALKKVLDLKGCT